MSETTKIQWADATFNPWIGCTKVSAGCAHCYAENTTRARVLRGQGHETWGKGAQRSRTSAATWKQPVRWNEISGHIMPQPANDQDLLPRIRVFPSLCDWLDGEVPIEWFVDFLRLIHKTPNLDWLLLTKRPENWRSRLAAGGPYITNGFPVDWMHEAKAPPNVWIGTSVENQAMADKRIPELLKIPAKIRFLSVEPMLEAIDLTSYLGWKGGHEAKRFSEPLSGALRSLTDVEGIDWVIVGGESGPNARPCNVEWIRDIVRQCAAADVPCFVKQLGSIPRFDVPNEFSLIIRDKKGGDPSEWPEDLRVRQFPKPSTRPAGE